MDLILKNGTIVTASESYVADIGIKDGKISAVKKNPDKTLIWLLVLHCSMMSCILIEL